MTGPTAARLRAGLTLSQAASQAGITESHLRGVERGGGCAYALALRLSRLYACRAEELLSRRRDGRPPVAADTRPAAE